MQIGRLARFIWTPSIRHISRFASPGVIAPPARKCAFFRDSPFSHQAISMTSSKADDDLFGDDSFLDGFDVDLAVQQQSRFPTVAPSGLSCGGGGGTEERDEKRRRITLSPHEIKAVKTLDESKSSTIDSLQNTLQNYFGYSDFREGQLDVLQAVIQKRDVAVFWATGSGKSLCYQIPALHLDQVAIVVSPLISLMEDQVHKLNSLSDTPLATFLGSGQMDPSAQQKAMAGAFQLVYVTPEKLATSGFLDQLASLHRNCKPICVLAVDEAHCVSEWGHDFRPDYRNLQALRQHPTLQEIPLLALTATAMPRVQRDITTSLAMRNPFRAVKSFDRHNLQIKVVQKSSSVLGSFRKLIEEWTAPDVRGSQQSTIVYCPTRSQVESVAAMLQDQLSSTKLSVAPYHAGLSQGQRTEAHTSFLTGRVHILVATVAFGMGIDKPDIRRVVHYGPSKTVEEYYQQIGRAGRDGLNSECLMMMSLPDFDQYQSEFYLGGLSTEGRQATVASMKALRNFALDAETCRRKALLDFFGERPSFGERCGTCDNCLSHKVHGSDATRDFGPLGAYVVLTAVQSTKGQGLSNVMKVIGGNVIEDYRYSSSCNATMVKDRIVEMKSKLPRKYALSFYKDLFPALVQKGFLCETIKSTTTPQGFQRSWTTYTITPKGSKTLRDSLPVQLPVPSGVRELEAKEEARRQQVLAELEKNGIKRDTLPQKELEEGDGEVIRAYSKWHSYLAKFQRNGDTERANAVEALLSEIEAWRSDTALMYRVAPASVLPEHLLVSIAYTTATMAPGMKIDMSSLIAVGVRTKGTASLVAVLNAWLDRSQPAGKSDRSQAHGSKMIFPEAFTPGGPWKYAVYKPNKKTGLATWEASYIRFEQGESPQTIAMSQPAGKQPIQASTVVGHLLDAPLHGRPLDFRVIAPYLPPPTKEEWEQLSNAEIELRIDVAGDPADSGVDGNRLTLTDFLKPIMGDEFSKKEYTERTQEEKDRFGHWCQLAKWYFLFRRLGYEPKFESG